MARVSHSDAAVSLDKALAAVLRHGLPVPPVSCPVDDSLGLVSARSVRAAFSIPSFDNSSMDGFAVRAADLTTATSSNPVRLRVIETLPAGHVATTKVRRGTAIRIMTGAPMPPGADAIVMVEMTETAGDEVVVMRSVRPGEHVRETGEDVRKGESILSKGRVIQPADIGLLVSTNVVHVDVVPRVRVGILVTGDELQPPGQKLRPGKIIDSNSHTIQALVTEAGGVAENLGIIPDRRSALKAAIRRALKNDIVITTGGVSVGDFDLTKDILDECGFRRSFWQVMVKPGRPTLFGTLDGRPVFGLPGNPVSSMIVFELLVRPLILRMMGRRGVERPVVCARLGESLTNDTDRTHIVRVSLASGPEGPIARRSAFQGSANLTSLSRSDGYLVLPPSSGTVTCGSSVEIRLFAQPAAERGGGGSPGLNAES